MVVLLPVLVMALFLPADSLLAVLLAVVLLELRPVVLGSERKSGNGKGRAEKCRCLVFGSRVMLPSRLAVPSVAAEVHVAVEVLDAYAWPYATDRLCHHRGGQSRRQGLAEFGQMDGQQ